MPGLYDENENKTDEEIAEEKAQEEPDFAEDAEDFARRAEKVKDILDKGKEKQAQTTKDTGKQTAKDTTKEGGKEAAKETGKETAKEVGKEAGKEALEKGGEEALKQGGKQVLKRGAEAATSETVVIPILIEIADWLKSLWDKYGDRVKSWWKTWWPLIIGGPTIIIVFLVTALFGVIFNSGCAKKLGSSITQPVNAIEHKNDILSQLARAGSRDAKLKLVANRLQEMLDFIDTKSSLLNGMSTDDYKKSAQILIKIRPIIVKIAELGKQLKMEETIKNEEENKKINKEIDKQIDEFLKLYKEFSDIYPGFKGTANVDEYVAYLKTKGINAFISDTFNSWRGVSQYRSVGGWHNGYDIAYGQDQPIYAGWPGTVATVYYVSYSNDTERGMEIDYGDYAIFYNHIYNPKVNPGDTGVEKGTLLGYIYRNHVDIKIRKNGEPYDWGRHPVE